MKIFNMFCAGFLLLVSSLFGCMTNPTSHIDRPQAVEDKRFQSFKAPLPAGYETWGAQHRFKIELPNNTRLFVEMFGTMLENEVLKVVTLVQINNQNQKEWRLWYYTDAEASIHNVYHVPIIFHTPEISKDGKTLIWKAYEYDKIIGIIDVSLRDVLGFTDTQIGEFHLLYLSGLFQTMFQVAHMHEKDEDAAEHTQPYPKKDL